MQKYLVIFFGFISNFILAQPATITSITVNITVVNKQEIPQATKISIANIDTKKVYYFYSNQQGKAICKIEAHQAYTIFVDETDEKYEYDFKQTNDANVDIVLHFDIGASQRFATTKNAVFAVKIFNNLQKNNLEIIGNNGFKKTIVINNDTGFIKLPIDNVYRLFANGVGIANNNILVDNLAYNILYYMLFFSSNSSASLLRIYNNEAVVFVAQKNLNNVATPNETIAIKSQKTGKIYTSITGTFGSTYFIVPKNDVYNLSLKHYQNFATISIEANDKKMITKTVAIKHPSSNQIESWRKEELDRLKTRDTTYAKLEKPKEKTEKELKIIVATEALEAEKGLEKDTKYFEKNKKEVCAVLYRNQSIWKNKVIVTDVTASMYPYLKQVALWQIYESKKGNNSAFIFFNDGDNKPDKIKEIGNTGGIYVIDGWQNANMVINTMFTAMQNGSGGDAAENNIEALMLAQKQYPNATELIMIVDNYSSVKDLELIDKITKPVRIIVCGNNVGVHKDYLAIAYATGGSIHTIEEDITKIGNLIDEEIFNIGNKKYQFIKGCFFEITK
jgi:uncharacterized protein YkuJ